MMALLAGVIGLVGVAGWVVAMHESKEAHRLRMEMLRSVIQYEKTQAEDV